jgi:hypothetical protein
MAWTQPRLWDNEIATAAKLQTELGTNQLALKDPPSDNYEPNEGSNYSYAVATYADVDSTNFSFSLTTTGGGVMLGFVGTILANGQGFLDVSIDGTRILNSPTAGLLAIASGALPRSVSFIHLVEGISAGVHTFVLQWIPSTSLTMYAGAGTANYDLHGQFWAREVS